VALGRPVGKQAWGMRLYTKPFVRWIWFGGVLMMLGGCASVIARRAQSARCGNLDNMKKNV